MSPNIQDIRYGEQSGGTEAGDLGLDWVVGSERGWGMSTIVDPLSLSGAPLRIIPL